MKYLVKFSVLLCMMIFVLSACSKVPAVNDPVNGTETSGYISWTELNAGPYWDSRTEDITYHMDVGEGSNTDVSFGNKIFAAVFVNWTYEQEMAKNDWYDINTFEKYGMPVDDNGNACVSTKVLLIYDYSGNLIADISLNELVGDFYESPLIFIDQEDQIHVWISMTAVDTKLTTYYHLVFDDKGNVLSRIPLFVDQYYFCFDICYDLKSGLSALVRNDKFERGLICFDDSGKMKSCGAEMACNCTALYYINGETMGRFDVWSEVDLTV